MALIDFGKDTISTPGYKAHWGIGRDVFTRQTEDMDQSSEADDMDSGAWGSRFDNMLPGQQKAMTKFSGIHSGVRGQVGFTLRPLVGRTTESLAWNALETLNALAPVEFQPVSVKKYNVTAKRKEVTKFDTELSARGDFNTGVILVSPKGNTQLLTTGSGSVDINSASTSYGGVVQVHCYDLAGGTAPSVTILVEHSVDGSVWTTLATCAAITNATEDTTFLQRIRIPSTTVVNKHVRASWTTANTPTSCQALVMFARGVDPDA